MLRPSSLAAVPGHAVACDPTSRLSAAAAFLAHSLTVFPSTIRQAPSGAARDRRGHLAGAARDEHNV
jgi:hypothetical protein